MKPKHKQRHMFILLITLTVFLFLSSFSVTHAYKLEVPLLGTKEIESPAKYINEVFIFALGAAGAVAFLMLVLGGIQYISSAGNASQQGDAKNKIQNAILGLLLLLGSYLILNTINPDLVNLEDPGLQTVALPVPGSSSEVPTQTSSTLCCDICKNGEICTVGGSGVNCFPTNFDVPWRITFTDTCDFPLPCGEVFIPGTDPTVPNQCAPAGFVPQPTNQCVSFSNIEDRTCDGSGSGPDFSCPGNFPVCSPRPLDGKMMFCCK